MIREETRRIHSQRLVSRMDPIVASGDSDCRHDWAAAQAWGTLSKRGFDATLSKVNLQEVIANGASDADILTLTVTMDLFARSAISEAVTARMVRCAQDVLSEQSGPDHGLTDAGSALTILQLRHLPVSGKARAWALADEPQDDSESQIVKILGLLSQAAARPEVIMTPQTSLTQTKPILPSVAPAPISSSQAPTPTPIHDTKFLADPTIKSVAERVNQTKKRKDCTDETHKKIRSTVALFTKVTGLNSIVGIEQMHKKFVMNTLDGLPTSFGKSDKDAARTIDEILQNAEVLHSEKMGLPTER